MGIVTAWQRCFRLGFAPQLSTRALEALRSALASDDRRLITGATTSPPPLQCCADWPVEAACPIALSGWLGEGLETVGETEEYFARLCYGADERLGEPAGCRWLLNHVDDTPREQLRRELLAEVGAELRRRRAGSSPSAA
jgi:hypothetical protein